MKVWLVVKMVTAYEPGTEEWIYADRDMAFAKYDELVKELIEDCELEDGFDDFEDYRNNNLCHFWWNDDGNVVNVFAVEREII